LIIDVTDSMYWFFKKHYIGNNWGRRVDLAGWSQVEFGAFFRQFLKRLMERNVKPIFVYSGARVNEKLHGTLASKSIHLETSTRATMRRLLAKNYTIQMPSLCLNALKEIINEFGLDQVHQSCYESHFVMAQMAMKKKCPILSSHSDCIFLPSQYGFIWIDSLPDFGTWMNSSTTPIETFVYYNHRMLDYFRLDPMYSRPLTSLYVILRDDFATVHYHAINDLLKLPAHVKRGPQVQDRRKTKRLIHILENWPKNLTTFDVVYQRLTQMPAVGVNLRRNFDGIWSSFDFREPLGQVDNSFITDNFIPTLEIDDLNDALTRRECSANFIMNLRQKTNFTRLLVEDIHYTFRSTFSLADPVRQYLNAQMGLQMNPSLFDRHFTSLSYRDLVPIKMSQNARFTRELLFKMFHFDEGKINELANHLEGHLKIDLDNAKRLSLLLYLAFFGTRVAFRETLDNSPNTTKSRQTQQSTKTVQTDLDSSKSSSGSHRTKVSPASIYMAQEFREKFYIALINSFVFHSTEQQGDTQSRDIPADHRVMRKRLEELSIQALKLIDKHDETNLPFKHMIETLNQTLSAYKEINSLYNFPGPNVLVCKCYDGVLIYRILSKWSNNLRDHLLPLSPTLIDLVRY